MRSVSVLSFAMSYWSNVTCLRISSQASCGMIFSLRLRARQPGLEVEILLDAVAVGPHLPHGLGAEDVLEDGGVDGAGGHGGPFRE